jgi:hypothetical protein
MKNVTRIILAGKFRGTVKSWESLKNFAEYHNAQIYIGYPETEHWNLPFFTHSVITKNLNDTIFENSVHPHSHNYIQQWSALYETYRYFSNKFTFADNDIVVKLRNDLFYAPFELSPLPNTIHTPSKEFHQHEKFPPTLLCNDQILYGYNSVMKKYFNLPYEFKYGVRNPEAISKYGDQLGIEETLRNYLYQQNLNLETFELNYKKLPSPSRTALIWSMVKSRFGLF